MNGWKRYLSKEIGIEFKACLYFYCILLFYCIYRILAGSFEADIIKIAQMVLCAYLMGCLQVFVLRNFDEAESFSIFGTAASVFCAGLYTLVSFVAEWFERDWMVTLIFFLFMLFCYLCVFLVYKIKRDLDTWQLNMELEAFKKHRDSDKGQKIDD